MSPRSAKQVRLHRRDERGFALLLTLVLVGLLVLLLAGLATYTRLETRAADASLHQLQARQNALMALNIALGQLQKYAGPDQRVTATAEAFGGVAGTKYYTGVWETTGTGKTALAWLVSGNEANGTAVTPSTNPTGDYMEIVGAGTAGTARDVQVPKQAILSAVPGVDAAATVGRYAWWIGDEGVKAAVAERDRTENIDYAPYTTAEKKSRLRQHSAAEAGAADAADGSARFEPRSGANSGKLSAVVDFSQLSQLIASNGEALGVGTLKPYFHSWTPFSYGVLADTKNGGLRRDVSLSHSLLGPEFTAWANYGNAAYMEDQTSPQSPTPTPAYSSDPLRRRYRIGTYVAGERPAVAPILSYFYILFGARKPNAASPYTLSLRWAAALWNPYTSALVPEDLRLEVSGLPSSVLLTNATSGAVDATISLRSLYGDPLKLTLPWDSTATADDRHSWLPGRVYNWVHTANAAFGAGTTNAGRFYSRDLGAFANGLVTTVAGSASVNGNTLLGVSVPSTTQLTVRLYRASDDQLLATYLSPVYSAFANAGATAASNSTSQIGFLFRLNESYDSAGGDPGTWLKTAGLDPRSTELPADAMRALPNGPNPSQYTNFITIAAPWRLIDRDISWGNSFNEDVPLFELPRAPVLSLGALQHLYLPGARPYAIGNSWGAAVAVNGVPTNELFDRFFFSGLEPGVSVDIASKPLPNQHAQPLLRTPDGATVDLALLQAAPDQRSSAYLQQSGAFNVNSTDSGAWAAVLRAGRYAPGIAFSYLNPSPSSDATVTTNASTAADTATAQLNDNGTVFYRYSQTAQEVYAASPTYIQSTTNAGGSGLTINTHLFRRGRRALSDAQLLSLAKAIAQAQADRQAAGDYGPFRSLKEFLDPSPAFTDANGQTKSLLEQAIAAADLNGGVAEFSSQWLTQGDLMTALAPMISARSDTFRVRAYGEQVNPVTGEKGASALCEAIVVRLPEPHTSIVAGSPTATEYQVPPGSLGRKFKIISLRWLNSSDI